jgi:hypothetical protein
VHLGDGGHDLEASAFSGPGLSGIIIGERGVIQTTQIANQCAKKL